MKTYKLQQTTIWSFPNRGNWATHKGDYNGNWSPHIPRNLILKYTKENDIVLDGFVGSGTTLIECKLLNRNGIGVDINPKALGLTKERLKFSSIYNPDITLINGSSTYLHSISNNSIDFICTHPPYADIIHYSNGLKDDLSNYDYRTFINELDKVAKEFYRILKTNHICSYMIGDIRKNGNVIPLGFLSLQVFQKNGFILKEIIIKEQHNCKSSAYWNTKKDLPFYLLAHEYIFVLVKKA